MTISMSDALHEHHTAADHDMIQLHLSDVRAWREAERKLLVGMVQDQIRISEGRILLEAVQNELAQLQESTATNARRMMWLEVALRNAEEA